MLATVSCMQEGYGPAEENLKEMTFSASVDIPVADVKTHLASDYSVIWDQMDDISVFSGEDVHTRFVAAALEDGGNTAIFTGLGAETSTYYAVYPYSEGNTRNGANITTTLPTRQSAIAGTFDKKVNVSAAMSATTDLEFKNLGALVGLSVQGTDVTTIVLESLDGETLMSGAVNVDFSGETPAMTVKSEGANYVQMSAPDGGFNAQSVYYFVVAPGTYNGLKLTFTNALSGTYTQEVTQTVTIPRNGHKTLGSFVIEDTDWVYTNDGNYTINGKTAVDAFIQANIGSPVEAVNITITGEDVGNEQLALISDAIKSVSGTLTLVGIKDGWLEPGKLLTKIDFKDLVIKNINSTIDLRHMNFTVYPGDLVLENINDLACADWVYGQVVEQNQNALHLVTEVKGDLTVRNVHKMGQYNFIALKKVGGNLTIDTGRSSGDNPGDNYGALGLEIEEIGGDLVLINNPINTLEGFDKLKSIGGNVVLTNNNNLPMSNEGIRVGYCIIKSYMESGVIGSGATVSITHNGSPVDVASLVSCGSTGGDEEEGDEEEGGNSDAQSLLLDSPDAVAAWIASAGDSKVVVNDLTLKGELTTDHLSALVEKISKVEGTLTFEEIGIGGQWLNLSAFIAFVDCRGDIVVRNARAITQFGWHGKTVLNGSLILDRIGDLATASWVNEGLCDIVEIKGDLYINGTGKIGEHTFRNLEKVGGNLSIIGVWASDGHTGKDLGAAGMSLDYIGGDLYLEDFPLESLGGFDELTHLGGNVILNLEHVSATSQDGKVGYCIFKDYMNSGVMSASSTIRVNGTDVTSTLQGCN